MDALDIEIVHSLVVMSYCKCKPQTCYQQLLNMARVLCIEHPDGSPDLPLAAMLDLVHVIPLFLLSLALLGFHYVSVVQTLEKCSIATTAYLQIVWKAVMCDLEF